MTMLITRDELEAAIDAGEVTVVDALPASYFEQQHLPGAVNLYVDEAARRAPPRCCPTRTPRSSPTAPTRRARTARASRGR